MNDKLLFKSSPVQVKFPDYLTQHDLVFESPARHWESGLALGNGDLGALHFVPESPSQVEWIVNKNDLWDLRHPANANRNHYAPHPVIMEKIEHGEPIDATQLDGIMFAPRGQTTQRSAGRLRFGPWSVQSTEHSAYLHYKNREINFSGNQRLSLADGVAVTKFGPSTFTSFIHAELNLLVIHVTNPIPLPIEIQRWADNTIGNPPEVYADGTHFGVGYQFPGEKSVWPQPYPELQQGIRYVMLGRIAGMNYKTYSYPERAFADFVTSYRHHTIPLLESPRDYTLFVTVVTSREADDPLQRAREILATAASTGYEALHASHRKWWQMFWSKSWIELPDKPLENLWYFGLYQLASCSRSEPLTGIAGLWFGPDSWAGHHDGVAFQSAYTNDQDTMVPHFWTLATNHPELLQNYLATFSKIQPVAEELTREMFGIDGMHLPLTTFPSGIEATPFPGRYNFISSPLVGMLYWMAWDYLRDATLLREHIYPFLRAGSRFFVAYMKAKDQSGRYQLWPCYPSEQSRQPYMLEHNPTGTLMMVKVLLQRTIEFARRLGQDKDLQAQIRELLEHYPEYPTGSGCFLQSQDEPDPHYHRHSSRIEAGFHNAEITVDDPPDQVEVLRNSLEAMRRDEFWGNDGNGNWEVFYFGGSLARLQMADELLKLLYGHALPLYLKPNGFLGYFTIQGADPRHGQEILTTEGSCGLGNCITEMLLQSYRGLIRVFPCWPTQWQNEPAAFCDLRAEGAFLVSASRDRGTVWEVGIFSERGGACHVLNPWPGKMAIVRQTRNDSEICSSSDRELKFATSAGERYSISPADKTRPEPSVKTATPATKPRVIKCLEGTHVWLGTVDTYKFWQERAESAGPPI